MADSNVTRLALASALKDLTKNTPLEKISVTDICRQCGDNRKSFYYHFRDKYDLVNWIFDSEFGELSSSGEVHDGLRRMLRLLEYFYENRTFYRRVLKVKGQNSFSEHFRTLLLSSIKQRTRGTVNSEAFDFRVTFYADAFICALERWLLGRDTMPPLKMFGLITSCMERTDELHEALAEA